MRYLHLLSWAASTAWAMEPVKAQAILGVLIKRAFGDIRAQDIHDDAADERAVRRAREERLAAERQAQADRGGIAIISLAGIISPRIRDVRGVSTGGGTSAEGFANKVRQAAADSNVTGIIIDVDSPGGNVSGIQEAAAIVREASRQKPVVAVANHWAASAAYQIASAAGELVVTPSGEVGAIGVFAYHEDVSAALEANGVKPSLIKAGDFKAETHPAFPLSEEATAYLQSQVDASYEAFIADVAKGRKVSAATVRKSFGQGRMVMAKEAVQLGMADRIGTLADEIARMQRARKPGRTSENRRRRLAVA